MIGDTYGCSNRKIKGLIISDDTDQILGVRDDVQTGNMNSVHNSRSPNENYDPSI